MSLAYSDIASQWQPARRSGIGFLAFSSVLLIASLIIGGLLSSIEVPEVERSLHVEVPKRIAQYIKKRPKPLPVPVVKKPEIKKPVTRKITKQRERAEKPLSDVEKTARDRVVSTGLLALSSELSALSNAADFSELRTVVDAENLSSIPVRNKSNTQARLEDIGNTAINISAEQAAKVDVQTHIQRRQLASLEKSTIPVKVKEKPESGGGQSSGAMSLTLEEEIGLVFEENKSRLYSIYERARRKNPNLAGKILLELSIDETGKVLDVVLVSSSLNDVSLEKRIIARIKQFVFASQGHSGVTKLRYPIEFLPG